MHVGVIIFCSVQTEIFFIKKTETGSNRFGSVFSVLARFLISLPLVFLLPLLLFPLSPSCLQPPQPQHHREKQ
jgi:hypothetical protein